MDTYSKSLFYRAQKEIQHAQNPEELLTGLVNLAHGLLWSAEKSLKDSERSECLQLIEQVRFSVLRKR